MSTSVGLLVVGGVVHPPRSRVVKACPDRGTGEEIVPNGLCCYRTGQCDVKVCLLFCKKSYSYRVDKVPDMNMIFSYTTNRLEV